MKKDHKQYLIMLFMCLVIAAIVVWASNNVDPIEDLIG